jgi:hypothetical protein
MGLIANQFLDFPKPRIFFPKFPALLLSLATIEKHISLPNEFIRLLYTVM